MNKTTAGALSLLALVATVYGLWLLWDVDHRISLGVLLLVVGNNIQKTVSEQAV